MDKDKCNLCSGKGYVQLNFDDEGYSFTLCNGCDSDVKKLFPFLLKMI